MPSLKSRIVLTTKCHDNCWYCYTKKDNRYMPIPIFESILHKMKKIFDEGDYTRFKLGISGGDPFYDDYILYAHKKVEEIFGKGIGETYSTASRFSELEIIKNYYDMGGKVFISINENNLKYVQEKIDFCKGRGRLGLFILLTEYNLKRLPEIIDLIVKNDIPFRLTCLHDFNQYHISAKTLCAGIDYIFKELQKRNYEIKPAYTLFECWNNRNMSVQYCGYGKHYYHFDVEGNLSRCQCEENIGHYTNDNLREKIYIPNIYHDECQDCSIFNICRGGCIHGNRNKDYCEVYKTVAKYFHITTQKKLHGCVR